MNWDGTWNGNNNQIDPSLQNGLTADRVYARDPRTGRPIPVDARTLTVNGDLSIYGNGDLNYRNDANYVGGAGELARLQRENLYLKQRLDQEDRLIRQLEARYQGVNNSVGWDANQGRLPWNPNQNQAWNQNQNQYTYDQYGRLVPSYLAQNQNQYTYDQYGRLVPSYLAQNQNQYTYDQYGNLVPAYAGGQQQGFNWPGIGGLSVQTRNFSASIGGNPGYYNNPNYMSAGLQGQANASYLWQMEQRRQQQALAASYYNGNINNTYNYATVNPSNFVGNSLYAGNYSPGYIPNYGPTLSIGNRNFRIGIGLG